MSFATSQTIKAALLALALGVMFCGALSGTSARITAASEHRAPRTGLPPVGRSNLSDDQNLILFKRSPLDTRARQDLDTSAKDSLAARNQAFSLSGAAIKQLRIVQFKGPIRPAWVAQLKATGSEIIGYIPNNAYIIRGTTRQLAEVAAFDLGRLASEARPIQWMGRFQSIDKIAPAYGDEALAGGSEIADVEIELLDTPEAVATIDYIRTTSLSINREARRFLKFVVLSVTIPLEKLLEIAGSDEVLFIHPTATPELHDERSAQIVAANLLASSTEPSGPGYRAWLESKGLGAAPDFVIDFTDSGLDYGSTAGTLLHPDFRDSERRSRVIYNINYTTSSDDDRRGHGSLVASIACGSGQSARVDDAGYMFGLGIDPEARLGASRIFNHNGVVPLRLSFTSVVAAAYAAGARVSNNSWGIGGNTYDSMAQEYDGLARDAQPKVSGNQEMTFIFSAGNSGAGGRISSPGTAKNVITVAASENFRPEGFDSCDFNGDGPVGPDDANNTLDISRFSSGGPTSDGRAKPDIAAPGTHIYGSASQSPFFIASGLCPGDSLFQPPGQQLYTWSSGTSLAAPHVTGAASLVRRFFTNNNLLGDHRPPSPAMVKAFLVHSASYLSGDNAGGDLPAERQGWGRANLGRAFDESARKLVDQTDLFTAGGQAFEIRGSLEDRSKPLRVTLAWTDAPAMLAGGPALVNNLDLEVSVGGVTIYRGNNFQGEASIEGGEPDTLNNVESIFIPSDLIPEGVNGNFTITVRATNVAGDGVPGNGVELDQDFALVAYNIAAPIIKDEPQPPPRKIPAITGASYVKKRLTITGHNFTAAAHVEINGQVITSTFEFDEATNSLTIKKKRKKLNLKENADNQIVIIDNNERSELFTLRL